MEQWIHQAFHAFGQPIISYEDFMNMALYEEENGYYMKDKEKIGRKGDFITNSSIHPIFAEHFAQLFIEWIKKEQLDPCIIELGGGTGKFAEQVIGTIKELDATLYEQLSYLIVDISPYHRKEQIKRLSPFPAFRTVSSLAEVQSKNAIIFANEWLDAIPTRVIEKKQDRLYELGVKHQADSFVEVALPTVSSEVLSFLERYDPEIPTGFRIEVPILMMKELKALYHQMNQAIFVFVDYGFERSERWVAHRKNGTIRGYYHHQLMTNVLRHVGDMDITMDVNWEYVKQAAEECDVQTISLMKQTEFFLHSGMLSHLEETHDLNPFSPTMKKNRAIRSFLTSSMSASFDVCIQEKGCIKTKEWSFSQPLDWK